MGTAVERGCGVAEQPVETTGPDHDQPTADDPATWLVGVGRLGWHAVERVLPLGGGWAVCGDRVRMAPKYGRYTTARLSQPICSACAWWAAIRSDALPAAIGRLPEPVRPLAEQIIARADSDGYELDHPRTVQLLTAVTDHAPTPLVGIDCAESGCGHDGDCPTTGWACDVCSLRAGGWAGAWEDTYFPECVVVAPCSVLTAIAGHYDVSIEVQR